MKRNGLYNLCKYYSLILLALFFFRIPQYFGIPRAILPILFVLLLSSQFYIWRINKLNQNKDKSQSIFLIVLFALSIIIIIYEVYIMFLK